MPSNLVDQWIEHCKLEGHITQAEAADQGKKPNPKKYASFTLSFSGERIYCNLPGCRWWRTIIR
jgi:hypothetical protein